MKTIDEEVYSLLVEELRFWKMGRSAHREFIKSGTTLQGVLQVRFLDQRYEIEITPSTKVKDIKIELSKLQNVENPLTYRLIYQGRELKVITA